MNASQAAYWVNAGWRTFHDKGLTELEYGRYTAKERILAQAGLDLAKKGFEAIDTMED
jgi:hypothetical protein